jgi:AcrR family transcriptional regulator
MPRQPASKRIQPLYPKLPSGRSALSSADIAANQRERLQGAVIYAISNRGYHNTTVADIIALAGVARRTFYEHFANKEACFLAAYDAILQRSMTRVAEAYSVSGSWEDKIQAAFLGFVGEVTSDPDAAQLVLIHSASAGEASIKRRNRGIHAFEALVRDSFKQAPAYREISDTTVKAIVGGVRQIIYSRLRHGQAIELPDLVPDLLTWARSYRHPVDVERLAVTAGADERLIGQESAAEGSGSKLSRGRHKLPRSFVIHNQRERIIDAVARICATSGYAELTVPDIASTAGVSHKTFYEHFASKDQAFLAAFEMIGQQALNAASRSYIAESEWPRAVHRALSSLADYLSSEPAFARMALVEVLAAGPTALTQRDQILQSFSLLLAPGHRYSPTGADVPAIAPEAISGGILEVLYFYMSNDRVGDMRQLVPQLTYIALAPFIGTEQAAEIASEQ